MRAISNDELKKIAVDILLYIDTLCREHNITYYLMFGTLIGAIRHKGFIPWDDDIDICLMRPDYEKLMALVEKGGRYKSIYVGNDLNYYFTYGRITDTRTILKRRPKRKIKDFGVYVDVFPIDNAPFESEATIWRDEFMELKRKVWATIPTCYDDFYYKNILRYILRFLREFKTRLFLRVGNFHIYRDQLLECTIRYNNQNTECLMIAETNSFCRFPKDAFSEVVEVEFEGIKAMAPSKYDQILRSIFGNYMELPPVEQRVSGHDFKAYWLQ